MILLKKANNGWIEQYTMNDTSIVFGSSTDPYQIFQGFQLQKSEFFSYSQIFTTTFVGFEIVNEKHQDIYLIR